MININNQIESVWTFTGKTKGKYRIPQIRWLAGRRNPVVLHKEYGTLFTIDVSQLTFSPGNSGERNKIVQMVKSGQNIVDLFACSGNLTLPAVVNNEIKTAWMMEINPLAYHYLVENIFLNNLTDTIIPLFGDNHHFSVQNIGDHVFLGILPKPDKLQLKIGIKALKNDGGWLHYHSKSEKGKKGREKVEQKVVKASREMSKKVCKLKSEVVKGLNANLDHIVVRAFLTS